MQRIFKKTSEFSFQTIQINRQRPATGQIFDLTIQTRPIAGIIGIQVDPNRYTPGTAGNYRIDIHEAGTIPAVIDCRKHDALYNPSSP
jgi:hypothetical protein